MSQELLFIAYQNRALDVTVKTGGWTDMVLQSAPVLSEEDAAWTEKLLPVNAPEECYMLQ